MSVSRFIPRPSARAAGLVTAAVAATTIAGCSSSGSPHPSVSASHAASPAPTANGEAAKSGREVFADMKSALRTAHSVHVSGPIAGTGSAATVLDMRYVNGVGAIGSVKEKGQTVQMVRLGDVLYVKGSPSLYGDPSTAAKIGDRYLKMSATSAAAKDLATLTDLGQVADNLSPTGTIAPKVTASQLDGQKVVVLTDTGDKSTVDVRATGSPVPLQLNDTGQDAGTVTFTGYDTPTTITAPTNVLVVPGAPTTT